MGILSDLLVGLVAIVGLLIGRLIGEAIVRAVNLSYFSIVLAVIGLIVAGFGLKRRGIGGAFVAGIGLGIATPITALITGLIP